MTSVVLKGGGGMADPSSWCIDAAGMKGTTNYLPVWQRGFRGMSGYIAGAYDIPQRCLEAWWELPDTWWQLNYERDPKAGLGGAATGAAYARDALSRIRDKGHQRETALIFSFVDFGPTASQFPVIDGCHQAMVDVCLADGQMPGAYGPPSYLRHLAAQPWWPTGAVLWQWGGGGAPEWWTTVKQAGPNSTPAIAHDLSNFGFAADENWLVTPMRGWTGYGTNPPPQPPEVEVVRLTILSVFDGAQELDAKFVGLAEDGWFTTVSWCDGPRLGAYRSKQNGAGPPLEVGVQVGDLWGVVLEGRLPTGDRFHTWTGSEFQPRDTGTQGPPGPAGPQGPPGPSPTGVTFTY